MARSWTKKRPDLEWLELLVSKGYELPAAMELEHIKKDNKEVGLQN
jgi:hypothetical protein